MNAYIAAGAIPQEDDPLFPFTQGEPKAMLDVAGKPMVQWVLDALNGAESIEQIGLVGLDEQHGLRSRKPLTFVPDQGDLLYNTLAGLSWARQVDPDAKYALFCSADIPAITAEAVQWRVRAAMERTPFDMDYAVVERRTMEARFPGSNRSYVTFRDGQVCGADLNLLRVDMAVRQDFWRKIGRARKSAWRQAALFGPDFLLLLLRRLTLVQAEERASQRLGLVGHLQISPYPELAMDVDKPHQLKILQEIMGHETEGAE